MVDTVGNQVRAYREANAWSAAQLARLAGVAPQTVAKMERGLPTNRTSRLKVAKALGKGHDEVFPQDA